MGVFCPEGDYDMTGGALDTFWRSAENFRMSTSFEWMGNAGMLWAVSQAAPLRRVVVDGDLSLYEYEPPFGGAGYSSGGFLASTILFIYKYDHLHIYNIYICKYKFATGVFLVALPIDLAGGGSDAALYGCMRADV